jgi:o-succinylbenzoate synthase
VKVRRLSWRKYRIPFRRTFVTSAGAQTFREGLIVRLDGEDGVYGLGEIAPLRVGSLEVIEKHLRLLDAPIVGSEVHEISGVGDGLAGYPEVAAAISCGLDIAACDLQGKVAGLPISVMLGAFDVEPVAVNATISADQPEVAAQLARRAVEQGFRCVKLKAGMMGGVAGECDLVGAVRGAIGADVGLRIDANQAWDSEQAIATIKALERFALELVEQPVAANDLEGLAAVRRAVNTPIAADEAITSWASAQAVIDTGAADVLVLKPMILGGLWPALDIIEMAEQQGFAVIVTTTIDSGVGIAAALHLAARAGGKRACGLATAELLECDLTSSTPQPRGGYMICPRKPGLGVEIDEAKAAPYLERA